MIPFLSPYRTAAIGLGTLSADLGAAVLLTSVLRRRLGFRAWRAVHWLACLAWPAAFGHALSAGGDLHTGWVVPRRLGAGGGRGLCAELLPGLITLDDWGFPIIDGGDLPASLRKEAAAVVRLCPRLALRLEPAASASRDRGQIAPRRSRRLVS